MPYIVVKAYPKDEKIKQEVAEEITRIFAEKWGCPRSAVTVRIEEYAPDDFLDRIILTISKQIVRNHRPACSKIVNAVRAYESCNCRIIIS